jgi:tRNA A-37 threonylcarbamoyl transferase component Bud32
MERAIGSGGMGTVWLATDTLLERPVAIKRLRQETAEDVEARQRILREARIAARLHDPRIVALFDVLSVDDVPWLVMEYLPSKSLSELLALHGRLAPQAAAGIGATVAEALDVAHRAGITHRDVKPGNVLLGSNFVVKLTDFGIAHSTGDATITAANLLTGTPAYFAPEVAAGDDPGPAADVWSLGATIYTAVEGHPPFGTPDGNVLRFLQRVATQPIQPPAATGPLTPILLRMLDRDPAARPSPAEAAVALRAVANGVAPMPHLPTMPAERRRARAGRIALVVTAVVAVLAIATTLVIRAVQRTPPPVAAPSPPSTSSAAPTDQVSLGDPRTADPCSLIDVNALSAYGYVGIITDYGELNTCQASITPPGAADNVFGTVKVWLLAPTPGKTMIGNVTYDGVYPVAREPAPTEGSCTHTIMLRDEFMIHIEAFAYKSNLDMCQMAETASRGALAKLRTGGIGRRDHPPVPPAANSLGDVRACSLLTTPELTAAGLTMTTPEYKLADWGCEWYSDNTRIRLYQDRTDSLTASEDGVPATAAGRTLFVLHGGYGPTATLCMVSTAQRSFTADGETRLETLRLTVDRPNVPDDARCATARTLLESAIARLPAPTP